MEGEFSLKGSFVANNSKGGDCCSFGIFGVVIVGNRLSDFGSLTS